MYTNIAQLLARLINPHTEGLFLSVPITPYSMSASIENKTKQNATLQGMLKDKKKTF